jgi:hypothetical protein
MFLIQLLFDKLGYMPKITVKAEIYPWPFPTEETIVKKQAKRTTAKKAATAKKKA